jgi:hypothetical protein
MFEVFDKIAQVEKLIEEIKGLIAVGEFKTPAQPTSDSSPRTVTKEETTVFPQEYKTLVKGILALAPGLSEIQLRKLTDDEKVKAAGLLTEEACLHLVANNLGFEIDGAEVKKKLPAVENAAPVKSELQGDGIDFNLVDYLKYGTVIKGKGYLEKELWGRYDKILFAAGYKYSKEEKAWIFQLGNQRQEQSQPSKAAPTKDRALKVVRISDLTTDLKSVTLEGQLLGDPVQRDINTKRGPTTITKFSLDDGSGEVSVTVWGDKGNEAMGLVSGDKVQLTSLMVKEPFDGVPQVSSGNWTKIIKL